MRWVLLIVCTSTVFVVSFLVLWNVPLDSDRRDLGRFFARPSEIVPYALAPTFVAGVIGLIVIIFVQGRAKRQLALRGTCPRCGFPTFSQGRCVECGRMRTKGECRATVKARLAAMPPGEVEQQSLALCKNLIEWLHAADARTVMIYAPVKGEADVRPIAAAWALIASTERSCVADALKSSRPHRVCLPRTDWARASIAPVKVTDWDSDLVEARFGLREPRPDLPVVSLEDLDAVLVPGLAFDRTGRRLGRGAGFYDRFLTRLPARVLTVGVALEAQMLDSVPTDSHDVGVHWLATSLGVTKCASRVR